MIGGIIVLFLFLTALVVMVITSQQYDNYQATVNRMSQKDVERFSENLQILYPGISWPPAAELVSCVGAGTCDQFAMIINNLAGIGTQIARIYINSTDPAAGCYSLCVLDPASNPTASSVRFSDTLINPSEANHLVNFWLATGKLTNQTTTVFSIVTTRGRIFSFQWPYPVTNPSVPTGSLYLGCLAIDFDDYLVTYTDNTGNPSTTRRYPTVLSKGWIFPGSTVTIFYVRVANICTEKVKLLDRSTFYVIQYTGAGGGSAPAFYIASPMSESYHDRYFPDSHLILTSSGNTYPSSSSGNNNIQAYNNTATRYPGDTCPTSDPCYVIPPAPEKGKQSISAYILFSAKGIQSRGANSIQGDQGGGTYVVFLAMYWQCLGNGDPTCTMNYEFGVTLPFITVFTCRAGQCPD